MSTLSVVKRLEDKESGGGVSRRELLTSGAAVLGALGLTVTGVAAAPPAHAAGSGWTALQFRSYDSRLALPYKPASGFQTYLDLTNDIDGNWVVPSGAVAVSYNLTATGTEGAGYLSLWTYGQPWPGTSSINWRQSGLDIANGGIVALGSAYFVYLRLGGNAYAASDFVIDVTGYFS